MGRRMWVPRRWMATEAYAARTGARWRLVSPAEPVVRRPPVTYSALAVDLAPFLARELPPLGVIELTRGYLFGPRGWVATRDRYLLPQQSLFGTNVAEIPFPARAHEVRRVRGVVASIATDHGWRNYGHFLYDGLGRVALLQRAGIDLGEVDWFYGSYPGERSRRLLERVGIPLDRLITPEPSVALRPDLVISTSFPGSRRDHPRWLIDWLRASIIPRWPLPGARRRLYVRRLATRRVANEEEIMPILDAYGFEAYVPEEHAEPPLDFAAAEAIVGCHGANLADMVFLPEGAAVIELLSSGHVNPWWYAQAETAGLRHGLVVCRATGGRAPEANRNDDSDVYVEPAELTAALRGLLGDGGRS